jgi:hypothetical protein
MNVQGLFLKNAVRLMSLVLAASCYVSAQDSATTAAVPQSADAAAPPNIKLRNTVEDWSDITLGKSELKMRPPNLGEIDHEKTYTRERWQVQWRDLDPIDLYIVKPVGVEKPKVIFYLYSYEVASKRPFVNDGWCQRVAADGFAAIGFVPALTEDRFQMRPMKDWFVSELQEALGETTHDVQMVLKYLQERGDFDLSAVGVFGTGSGATVGILAAAADPRIQALDLVNPWADWPDWLKRTPVINSPVERKNYTTPEFEAKVAPLDPVKWLPKLSDRHVRIQIIDEAVAQEKASLDALEQAAPREVKFVHYPTVAQHKAAYIKERSFDWVKAQLTPTVARQESSASVETHTTTAKP